MQTVFKVDEVVLLPESIGVCPDCNGPIFLDHFEGLTPFVATVNLYVPKLAMLRCYNCCTDGIFDGPKDDNTERYQTRWEIWQGLYQKVQKWLRGMPFLIERNLILKRGVETEKTTEIETQCHMHSEDGSGSAISSKAACDTSMFEVVNENEILVPESIGCCPDCGAQTVLTIWELAEYANKIAYPRRTILYTPGKFMSLSCTNNKAYSPEDCGFYHPREWDPHPREWDELETKVCEWLRRPSTSERTWFGPDETYVVNGDIEMPLMQVPTHVATCPDCAGELWVLNRVFDLLDGGGYRYKPSMPEIYCLNETPGSDQRGREWIKAYDNVRQWLETQVVELNSKDFDGAAPPKKIFECF